MTLKEGKLISNKAEKTELPKGFSVQEMVVEDIESYIEHKRICWMQTYPNDENGITPEDVQNYLNLKGKEMTKANFRVLIQSGASKIHLLKKNGIIVGDIIYTVKADMAEINEIYLQDEVKGKGLGKFLMKLALANIPKNKKVYLGVLKINLSAIKFYERFGFKKVWKVTEQKSVKFGNHRFAEMYIVLSVENKAD